MAERPLRKTTQMTIRLEPHIYNGIVELASIYGMAPTTLASMAIGQYISKELKTLQNVSKVQEQMVSEMAKNMTDMIAPLFKDKTPEQLKEIFGDD